ncbi:MAG: DNRLRE domain-containing protein, partial [Planctomycetaceae bacterium]
MPENTLRCHAVLSYLIGRDGKDAPQAKLLLKGCMVMAKKQSKTQSGQFRGISEFQMLEPRLFLSTTVLFREGGGTGYTDTAFDDTTLSGTVDTADGSNANLLPRNSTGVNYKISLLAVKDLFTLLPQTSGSDVLSISSAKLHLFRYNSGSSSDTIYVDRTTSNWLLDSAGSSEADVTFLHRDKSADLHWAGGSDFSSADYTTTNEVSSAWVDNYNQEKVLDITSLMQDIYSTSTNYGFTIRTDASGGISLRSAENTLSYRPVLEITYDYVPTGYTLTVNSGTGDGTYDED